MRSGTASGLQIAFFTYAVLLLAVPLTQWLAHAMPALQEEQRLLDKAVPFILASAILLGFPGLRRLCRDRLADSIPPGVRLEVIVVMLAKLLFPFAFVGGMVFWHWTISGEPGVTQYLRGWASHDTEMARAFEPAHVVRTFLVAGLIGPVIEELVFRGMLYRAWERQIGWLGSMILVSILFALYHRSFASAFFASIVFVCLYRRTGSLWAPIIVHVVGNIALWYPLLGRHVMPRDFPAPGSLSDWGLHLVLFVLAAFALPAYVWMARNKHDHPSAPAVTAADGTLPQ